MLNVTSSKPTLKDVAHVARCSTAVVSTVINNARGNTLVSAAMQERVRAAARQLGYRPNFASRSLVRRSAQTIGIYVPPDPWAGLGMRYEAAVVRGIEQACRDHGYDVLAINLSGATTPDTCFHKFAEQRIDGVILLHVDHHSKWIERLAQQSPNVVAVNYYGPAPVDRVNFDDRRATELAVRHLVEQGHERIGYLGSWQTALGPGAERRCAGYRRTMRQLGLPIRVQWVWDSSNPRLRPADDVAAMPDRGEAGALHLWRQDKHRPTALVAYCDLKAARAMRQLQQLGASVPRDISIVGIDGSDFCELMSPELTSVLQPFAAMGRRATELLIRKARRRGRAARRKVVRELAAPELVLRQSTASPPPQ